MSSVWKNAFARQRQGSSPVQSAHPTQAADSSDRETLVGHRKNRLGCCRRVRKPLKSRGVGAIASDGHTIICIILLLSLFMIFYSIGGKSPTRVSRSGPQTWNIAKSLEHCVVS